MQFKYAFNLVFSVSFYLYFFSFADSAQPLDVTNDENKPGVKFAQGFFISVIKLVEHDSNKRPMAHRTYPIDVLDFIYSKSENDTFTFHNYTTTLENDAILNVFVSSLSLILFPVKKDLL